MNEKLIWMHLALGPLVLILAVVMMLFPPGKINHLYGYRTLRSMKNQQAWDFANRFSARYMVVAAVVVCLVQISTIMWLSLKQSFVVSAICMTVALISVIPVTEWKLREKGF